jgi:glycosyltransferase involved in cell wall biosynthesis
MVQEDSTIFVSVIAYNEPDINQTISNCLANAANPSRVSFGVWNHYSDEIVFVENFPKTKVVNLQYNTMLGVGVARLNALSLYDGEDYILQIDAHMLFDKDWDVKLINRYLEIRDNFEKPVITCYVGWWSRLEDGTITKYSPENSYKNGRMIITNKLNGNNPIQSTEGVDWTNKSFEEHHGFSAHFVFAEPHFFKSIVPDPEIMFSGEETTTALRAWTRGYRLFCIPESIAWHRNKGEGVLYKNDRWKTLGDKTLAEHYNRKSIISQDRTEKILTGKILGYWGAPSPNALAAYEKAAKVNFKEIYGNL